MRDSDSPLQPVNQQNQTLAGLDRDHIWLRSTSSNPWPGLLPSPSQVEHHRLERRLVEEIVASLLEEVLASNPSDHITKTIVSLTEQSSSQNQAMTRNMQSGDGSSILTDKARLGSDAVVSMPGQDEVGVLPDKDGFMFMSDMTKAELDEGDQMHVAAKVEDKVHYMEEHLMSQTWTGGCWRRRYSPP